MVVPERDDTTMLLAAALRREADAEAAIQRAVFWRRAALLELAALIAAGLAWWMLA